MRDITTAPFFIRLGKRQRGPANSPISQIKRVNISNIVVSDAHSEFASIIAGLPESLVEDVNFSNIYIEYKGGGTKEDALREPPENEKNYPEPTFADVVLPDVLGDSMVLQRQQKIPIRGKADAGEAVKVSFGKQKLTAIADQKGNWRVDLKPLKASFTAQSLTIEGKNKIELKNILVGEVWLVSGNRICNGRFFKQITAKRKLPKRIIRTFDFSMFRAKLRSRKNRKKLGEWKICNPESVKDFSGAGYYFGVELQRNLNVPIGLINSSYGGSQAEAWTPTEYLNANPDLKATVERTKIWEEERPRVKAEYAAAIEKWKAESEKQKVSGAKPSPSPSVPDALRDYRIASSIYDGMIEPLIPFAIRGAAWYQGESNEARAEQYNILLPTMIKSWREKWAQGNFPFVIIQLPNYRKVSDEPENSPWSFIREAQRKTAENTSNTGLNRDHRHRRSK
ncbi:sialate O-acetylesterase [Biomphalaria pfeifferi]|uniref:Sialate O-acetylesterase n=1 Tax=Biomphalaria pfeifferi TaxID=112525 RepID=A0AAD8ETI7_BIOPF|nr:sialate O-acetylesterase [Biomphalaria pfeifferi]